MIRRYVELNAMMPRGYGRAWYEGMGPRVVCYPVPLNLILGRLRDAWLWLQYGRPGIDNAALATEYRRGYEHALHYARAEYDRGYRAGLRAGAATYAPHTVDAGK